MAVLSALLLLLISGITLQIKVSSAAYILRVRLHSYSNEEHKLSSGVCCDEFSLSRCDNSCDNLFNFCLRSAGQVPDTSLSNCSLGLISLTFFYPDLVDFHQDSVLPFFSREAWSGSEQLYIRVRDYDGSFFVPQTVDYIFIPVNSVLSGQSSRPETFNGIFGHSEFEVSFQLDCLDNFYREDCSEFCEGVDSDEGHFRCGPNGERICLEGWEDPSNHCLTPVCEECNVIGGMCTAPNECTCLSGWDGMNCQECIRTSPGCSTDGGFCNLPGECLCRDDYGGSFCEVYLLPCEYEPCQNGAVCSNDGLGSYTCNCTSGFAGHNCSVPCDINSCRENGTCIEAPGCIDECNNSTEPCLNGGTCQDIGSVFRCDCGSDFTGAYCETSLNICHTNPCMNQGVCIQQSEDPGYTCNCTEGFIGQHCEEEYNYCDPLPCENNGTCTNGGVDGRIGYTCTCLPGWVGQDCDQEKNECEEFEPCKNGGNCTDIFNGYECVCAPGFNGIDCEHDIDECLIQPCGKNGNCTNHHGGYTCQCHLEYTGEHCEIDLNACRSKPCVSGGTCENTPDGGYVCVCLPGYTGFNCEEEFEDSQGGNVDRCFSLTCVEGICKLGKDGNYFCACRRGFTGENCSTPLDQNAPINGQRFPQETSGIDVGSIVGGVFGGVVTLLAVIIIILLVCIIWKRRRRWYSKMYSADLLANFSLNGEGHSNPTYISDNTNHDAVENEDHYVTSSHTYSSISDNLPLLARAAEQEEFDVEYHNFNNPLYTESSRKAENSPPTYSKTSQVGPRGNQAHDTSSTGNGSASISQQEREVLEFSSAVPGPMEYDYVSLSQSAERGGRSAGNPTRNNRAGLQGQIQDNTRENVYQTLHN